MNFYTLTGTPGWSWISSRYPFDVSNIQSISIHKRLFCLWDIDKPYTMTLIYKEQNPTFNVAQGFGPYGASFSIEPIQGKLHTITARYNSYEQAMEEKKKIEYKKEK